ncbi:DL-endopeptidase inhibitor IseA family protein [Cytobacillus firmus]|uniref:DL-endopeptidase inhibitor IseA family protein n=1 Tax=Cytobacillus firmus TaxID=1399 RepID=UPI003001408C
MKGKTRAALISIPLIAALLGGCSFFPEPAALIEAPGQGEKPAEDEGSILPLIKAHLPKGTSLFVPNSPVGSDAYLKSDLNNDGFDEIIAFYKSFVRSDYTGAMILQQENGKWKKAGDIQGSGYEVSWGSTEDFTGDGKPELLLGWKIGVSAGSILDVYKWDNGKFIKLSQQNYHELDLIYEDDSPRLAIWRRESADVYDINILKWLKGSFVPAPELYPAYFLKTADYYKQRTAEVPDAASYWYYLADSLLKAEQPEQALEAIEKGVSLKVTVPGWNEFEQLRGRIEKALLQSEKQDIHYYDPQADLTMNYPKNMAGYLSIDTLEGENNEFIIQVNASDKKKKALLFSIEVYAKEFVMEETYKLSVIAETDHLLYVVRRGKENPIGEGLSSELNSLFQQRSNMAEEMISSIRLGAPFAKYTSFEDEMLLEKIQQAYEKVVYAGMGGKMESGEIHSFPVNGMDYRYLGKDLGTKEKFIDYLADSFTEEAIQSFMAASKIIDHNGKLAQPNADGGSLLNYEKAEIVKVKDLGTEMQFDIKVPLGNSLTFQMVPIVFKKTENGWRISTNPVTM